MSRVWTPGRVWGGYTGRVMEVLTLVFYRLRAAASEAVGVTIEHRQAPD